LHIKGFSMNLLLLNAQADARWNLLCGVAVDGAAPVRTGGFWSVWRGGAVLAACAAISILWMFHNVVSASVVQGEARRVTAAQHEMAVWHCARSGGRAQNEACVSQIGTSAR
jgi:hypothetical protein